MDPPLQDCHGINCPLGIAHPPPNKDPTKGGVFPLGCGICRSEKLELLANKDIRQVVVDEQNLPKFYNKNAKEDKFERPLVEIEMPDFVALAEELYEAERLAKEERLAKMPIFYLSAGQILKKEQAKRRRERQAAAYDEMPDWFLNPQGELTDE